MALKLLIIIITKMFQNKIVINKLKDKIISAIN